MPYRYEATSDFVSSISEADTLLELANSDDNNRVLFLKLAIISAVTKFQVFVEKILDEFRYELNDKPSQNLSTYMKLNSLRISLSEGNSLIGLTKHNHFTEEKKNKIVQYLQSISYISDDNCLINDDFRFTTKFPLGRTGKNELINLLKQIDGNENPFAKFGNERFDNLDSILQTRHNIIHQDRFNGTETTVRESVDFLKDLVVYIDEYLSSKIDIIDE
jgi:hypothetical protein